jgi:hypothetical protein
MWGKIDRTVAELCRTCRLDRAWTEESSFPRIMRRKLRIRSPGDPAPRLG